MSTFPITSSKVAICYDFDRTLTPLEMQAQGFIQSLGLEVRHFWQESDALAKQAEMDNNLAYMYLMIKHHPKGGLRREELEQFGQSIRLFSGLDTWFERLNRYAQSLHLELEHYVISSGIKEMIESTSIASQFKRIYANSFYYNEQGLAVWPAQIINFTNKTQFLFRISKGALDLNDDAVNAKLDTYRIPFSQIIYIGDSQTDVPCMKLLKDYQGYSVGVYEPKHLATSKVKQLLAEGRISFYAEADYQEESALEQIVKGIITKIKANQELNTIAEHCFREIAEC
ncbi:MAG: haloacid dehalogenase-like hydrolase, partial [Succinivibrio sp.]|nr:haloacid dehalogenase-like hydrolase [Succinivibrio sp.]